MWVLILTITLTGGIHGGVDAHIHHIEFQSEKACKNAGKQWLETVNGESDRKSALCVHTGRFGD